MMTVSRDGDLVSLSLGAATRSIALSAIGTSDEWARQVPDGRTRVHVVVADKAEALFEVYARGRVSVPEALVEDATVVMPSPDQAAFEVSVPNLDRPVPLFFRLDETPKVVLRDGFGFVTKGLGSRNEGSVSGDVTIQAGEPSHLLVMHLDWAGTRLFGLIGGKSRTVFIPINRITSASIVRRASRDAQEVSLSEAVHLHIEWKVPPNAKDRAKLRPYSIASAKITARVSPAERVELSILDAVIRAHQSPDAQAPRFVCCYAGSSLAGFLRFSSDGTLSSDRCDTSRKCSGDEVEAFDRME